MPSAKPHPAKKEKSGLGYWMTQVLKEAEIAAQGFSSDPVHDLRVALRRCRSMTDGFRAIDPDKNWKKMRRQATTLFDALGELRDCQVMMEWLQKLARDDDPISRTLMAHAQAREMVLKQHAEQALAEFDRGKWQSWARLLPARAARLTLGSEPFQALALEKWTAARRLESRALKTEEPMALHRMRIAVKKFRYVVENFLPEQHEQWSRGLKEVQDLLGEIHDLDVLRQTSASLGATSAAWEQKLSSEREKRLAQYRELMCGAQSLWLAWRAGLPSGQAMKQAALRKLEAWSGFMDSDLRHSRRVTRFALQIFDGLERAGLLQGTNRNSRELLRAAATAHEVGRAGGNRGHHKTTERMIEGMDRLVGWTRSDLEMMALVARYHRGALPHAAKLRLLSRDRQATTRLLAGILRLANSLDADHKGTVRQMRLTRPGDYVLIQAQGLRADSALAEQVAGARHLLETACGMPVMVRGVMRGRNR
jgi:CHAD domain-containing protein